MTIMKVINSQDYNNIDDFFNYFNECVRNEKNYTHSLHCDFKEAHINFVCDEIENAQLYSGYEIYKKNLLISILAPKDIETANFWFVSYQELK